MKLTPVRTGLVLAGTAAVLVPGAFGAAAFAGQAAPAQAPAAQTATPDPGKGSGNAKGGDAAARGRAGVTYLAECVDDNRVRQPKTFTLACADSNQRLENLRWTGWGSKEAQATGVVRENVSSPMSKGDKWITYKVKVTASDLVDGEASATYNKLTVRVVGKAPKGTQPVEVFELPGNEPVTSLTKPAKRVVKPANKPIDHMNGWSDGHEGQSEDPIPAKQA